MPDHETWKYIIDGAKYIADVGLRIVGVILQIATTIAVPFLIYLEFQNSRVQKQHGAKLDTAAVASVLAVEEAKEAKEVAVVLASKVDETAQATASTNAIQTEWWAKKTGDPEDEAKAQAAKERLDKMP